MGSSLITYDSPWAEICEAARSAPWSATALHTPTTLTRPRLSQPEVSALAGMPVLLLNEDELPPHPKHHPQVGPVSTQFNEMMAQRAGSVGRALKNAGPVFNDFTEDDSAIKIANNTDYFTYTQYSQQGSREARPLRRSGYADTLSPPMPHRLEGDLVPHAAIMVTNPEHNIAPKFIACAEQRVWLPEADYQAMSDLHEVMHLLQLRKSKGNWLIEQTGHERDAENGAMVHYQAGFDGPPGHAAARIISHVSMQFQMTANYGFYPGQAADKLGHGAADATALRLHALYAVSGRTPPRFLALQAIGHMRAKNLPVSMVSNFGDELAEISQFAKFYTATRGLSGMLKDTLTGLKAMSLRDFDMIPQEICPLARQITDAATFTNPTLMGSNALKPRITYHLAPKTNDATLA